MTARDELAVVLRDTWTALLKRPHTAQPFWSALADAVLANPDLLARALNEADPKTFRKATLRVLRADAS